MGDSLLDVLIARYLRSNDGDDATPSLRGQLHETPPQNTTAQSSHKNLPNQLGVSFIPLLNRTGGQAGSVASTGMVDWAKNTTHILGRIDPNDQEDIIARYGQFKSMLVQPRAIIPGMFYTFRYQATTVDAYDRFPLVLPLQRTNDGILGMNFHYLPPKLRFALFEAMMPLVVPLPVAQLSLIRATYQRLIRRRLVAMRPTIKRYVYSQMRSQAVFISPLEWAVALAYPSEQFVQTSPAAVWAQSRKTLQPAGKKR